MKYLILTFFAASFFIFGCSKEENNSQQQQNQQKVQNQNQNDESDNPADTNLTPEEKFSSSIQVDFLDDSDDDDLAAFLENEIYKMGASYNGAAVIEITPSTWLVSFEKSGNVKNYILQKYVDFKTNEYYFSFKETTLTNADVVSRTKPKKQAEE
ncbi:MAG: hypothetical protein IT280_03970 [Ignavibacteria bacterium]|nr:hypothetical protein [Ignavibacteria bacterium]